MRLSLQVRLIVASLLLLTITALVSGYWLEGRLRQTLHAQNEAELRRLNTVVAEFYIASRGSDRWGETDVIADAIGEIIERRVTIIEPGGRVLGDSALDGERLSKLDNHAQRPEIVKARNHPGLQGVSLRYSGTIRTQMLYVARTVQPSASSPVVRVSMPLEMIEVAVDKLRLMVVIAGLIAGFVCILMSLLAARVYGRRLERIAARMRSNLSSKHVVHDEGIDGLVQSMDRIGQDIESLVDTLIQERDRFLAVLETMGAAVIALDAERNITVVNSAARRMLEISGDPIGKPLVEVIRVPKLVELTLADLPETVIQDEVQLNTFEGNRVVLVRAAQQRMRSGLVMVLHDITEIRHLESIRRDFVANVSHELRTPVSVIRANAETLLDGALDDAAVAQNFTQAILRNSERLATLLSNLLDLARMEAGETVLKMTAVSIHESVAHAFDTLEHVAEDRGVTLHNEVPTDFVLRTDSGTLDQVLLNLVGNGIKYGKSGDGHVWVRTATENGVTRLEIIDDGPGIEAHHRDRIFERFYRVDPGRSRDMGGTGLGLAIVKHLVGLMGGTIGIEPREGGGSIFWAEIPNS